MKICLLFLVAFVQISWQDQKMMDVYEPVLQKVRENCQVDSQELLQDVLKTLETGNFPDDEKIKCFYKCVLRELDVMDKSGKLEESIFQNPIYWDDDTLAKKTLDNCKQFSGDDSCNTAYEFIKCGYALGIQH